MLDAVMRARVRHAIVGRLPGRAREALAARAVPRVDRFVMPLPGGDGLELASPGMHRTLARLYWQGPASYEPATVRTWWCLARHARHVVDVGAYIGYYALLAARATPTARVQAVEPLAEGVRVLARLAQVNGAAIQIHEAALGARTGTAELVLPASPPNPLPTVGAIAGGPRRRTNAEAAASSRTPTSTVARPVAVTTLDAIAAAPGGPDPDLIKLDVEGGEPDMLAGGRRTIARAQPDIIMEVRVDEPDPPEAVRWLADRGYRTFDLTSQGPRAVPTRALADLRNVRRSATHRYGEVLMSARSDHEIAIVAHRVAALGWPT